MASIWEYVRVISVQVLGHYQLRLGFSDGSSRDADLTEPCMAWYSSR